MKLLLSVMISISAFASIKVIYGLDNRIEWYQIQDPSIRQIARSTAAMIENDKLSRQADHTIIENKTLHDQGVCSHERFSSQIAAASCSGFLVGDDLLVTAGHCITGKKACKSYSWVFDYKLEYESDSIETAQSSNVYKCAQVIERSQSIWNKNDYALIRLDRKVLDRAPLKFRTKGSIDVGAPLMVIGHPSGLPLKLADGANARELKGTFFKADLDTYGGNSGSAVFNTETLEVEGILVRGAQDYVKQGGCMVSNVVAQDEGRGEDVTYITNIEALNSK